MQLKLKVLEGSRLGMEVPVPGPKFFIGRDEDCQLRPRSDLISRHHCVLLVEQGYVAIRDFGSKNGTIVNGQRISGEQPLKAGDTVTVGPLRFEVIIHHGVGGPKRPKVKDLKDAANRTAARPGDGEANISDWLSDDEQIAGGNLADPDASRVNLGQETSLSDTSELRGEAPTDVARSRDEPTRIGAAPATPKGTPADPPKDAPQGRGGKPAEPKAKDTQSAAVDVLRKFREQQNEQKKQQAKK